MKSNPVISVVFSAHNADAYIDESLQSILNQSFSNFEIIAIDDASTGRNFEILNKYRTSDDRIRIIQNKKNLGLAASLNLGIDLANAPFIARMDADDIAFPQRLQKQVNFLQKNPDIAGCGTSIEVFGASQGLQKKAPIIPSHSGKLTVGESYCSSDSHVSLLYPEKHKV